MYGRPQEIEIEQKLQKLKGRSYHIRTQFVTKLSMEALGLRARNEAAPSERSSAKRTASSNTLRAVKAACKATWLLRRSCTCVASRQQYRQPLRCGQSDRVRSFYLSVCAFIYL